MNDMIEIFYVIFIVYLPLLLPIFTFLLFWKKDTGRRYITFLRAAGFSLFLGVLASIPIFISEDPWVFLFAFYFAIQAVFFLCIFAIGAYLRKRRLAKEKIMTESNP